MDSFEGFALLSFVNALNRYVPPETKPVGDAAAGSLRAAVVHFGPSVCVWLWLTPRQWPLPELCERWFCRCATLIYVDGDGAGCRWHVLCGWPRCAGRWPR